MGDTVAGTGGSAAHSHTYTEVPAHSHGVGSLAVVSGGAHTHGFSYAEYSTGTDAGPVYGSHVAGSWASILSSSGAHVHTVSGTTGVSGISSPQTETASNLPPTITVVFCRKVTEGTPPSGGSASVVRKYYYAGTTRVAMRFNEELFFIVSDHLGSTSLVLDAGGDVISETRYTAWGEERYSYVKIDETMPTDYTYTGQRSEMDSIGLLFYKARWYDPWLGRFSQADTLQGLDRYAYVGNSPTNRTDPSGHKYCDEIGIDGQCVGASTGHEQTPENSLVELTESGERALATYEAMEKLAEQNGIDFTVEDFIRIVYEREINGFGGIDNIEYLFMEASVRNYWYWSDNKYGTHDQNTLFNWLGSHNYVVTSLYNDVFINYPGGAKDYSSLIGDQRDYASNVDEAMIVAQALLNPSSEWMQFDPNAVYTFGFCDTHGGQCSDISSNNYDLFELFGDSPLPLGIYDTSPNGIFFKRGISFFLTFNQVQYWNSP